MSGNSSWHPRRQASDPARLVAFDALMMVEEQNSYANLVLPKILQRARLNKRDSAFATTLTYGTVRLQGRWDEIISRCSQGRSIDEIELPVLVLLRMGCYQLLELGTPAHAAINETVAIVRNEVSQGAAGFANAVLRRVSEKTDREDRLSRWHDILQRTSPSREAFLSCWYSHPRWIVRELSTALEAYGRSEDARVGTTADDSAPLTSSSLSPLESVLEANNSPAHVALVARDITVEMLDQALERAHMSARKGEILSSARILESGDPGRLWAVQRKEAGVQDEGSQLISELFVRIPLDLDSSDSSREAENQWLDMCAGPGGKTATIAGLALSRNAHIFANELHPHRLDLVEQAVGPFADIVSLREGDGRDIGEENPSMFSRTLVDAPCSGLGALRRRPESRWRKEESDIASLHHIQVELLESAYEATCPGGMVMYTTCSPVLEETQGVVNEFLESHQHARIADIEDVVAQITDSRVLTYPYHEGTCVQLWPDLDQSDAMFACVIIKEK